MHRFVAALAIAFVVVPSLTAAQLPPVLTAARAVEPVVLKGSKLVGWSGPPSSIVCMPWPSGALIGQRDAHNGVVIPSLPIGAPVDQIAAYRWDGGQYVEIPVQVDEMFPYCLSNPSSDFGVYSGTDLELSYAWDTESWKKVAGLCSAEYPLLQGPTPDPVPTLDDDDEVVFMASDAGAQAPVGTPPPPGATATQVIAIVDALDPATTRFAYLVRKPGGSSFDASNGYVDYARDANADEYIDRYSFAAGDPEQLGSSNTGYGPNIAGTVCVPNPPHASTDRFPRDGTTVSTETYRWRATGRWMVRQLHVAKPGEPGVYGPDLIDRWKGRAFQQSPDSTISLVGFEDEQVNWEANSSLLGERTGPVRAIRETWGADSGTNVTKTESFYRDAITYRYHVRVHPIPPDGLYTSWDYNAGVVSKYYNVLKPDGVDIDGLNDDTGNIDSLGNFPAFFDIPDPTFNLPSAVLNWEQISGAGDNGSLVYIVELKGATTLLNPAVVPYYRDDKCLDDGTGDDPVPRPWPGEASTDTRVHAGYSAAAGGTPYDQLTCDQKQGAWASHGIHYLVTHDTDNAATPGTLTEIDAQQWQFMVPTAAPANVADPYANVVRVPLQTLALPLDGLPGLPPLASPGAATTDQDVPVTITLTGLDVDTCDLTFAIDTPPTNGTLDVLAAVPCVAGVPNTDTATVVYTPAAGYAGPDAFTFVVDDGTSTSLVPGSVAIVVNPIVLPTATPTATPAEPTPTATPTVAPTGSTPSLTPNGGGLCGDAPRNGCRKTIVPKGSLLTLKKGATPDKDRLGWKWAKGELTAKGDFGIPTETTDYDLCVYDGNDDLLLSARAPAGQTCRTNELRDCWKENTKGFRYVDRDLTPDGLQQVGLKAGPTGKAQITVKGRGANLGAPALPLSDLPARVQLVNGGGACWEATYTSTFQNTTKTFKAKSD